jgi:hypothetical protein
VSAMPVALLLAIAAFVEAATGAALIVVPNMVAVLLLGDGLSGTGLTVGRVTGVALLALAVGSWIGRQDQGRSSALAGMLTYNALAAIYLAYLGMEGVQVGKLLWPTVVLHATLGLLLVRAWYSHQPGSSHK